MRRSRLWVTRNEVMWLLRWAARERARKTARIKAAHTKAWRLGSRTLLAATCNKCGKLFDGNAFKRHLRRSRDQAPYLDRRCPNCKWGAKLKGRQG